MVLKCSFYDMCLSTPFWGIYSVAIQLLYTGMYIDDLMRHLILKESEKWIQTKSTINKGMADDRK